MRRFAALCVCLTLAAPVALAQSPEEEGDAASSAATEQQEAAPVETPAAEPAPVKKPAPKPAKPAAKPKPKEAPATAPATTGKPTPDYVMLRVGTQDITASEVKRMWSSLFPPGAAPEFEAVKPELRDKVLRGVVTERLLFQEATKLGIDKSDAVVRELEDIKRKLYVKALLEAKSADINEKDLQSEYEKSVADMRDVKEVRARHILVADEKTAKEIKKKLDEGKSFEELARELSKDPGSAKQGGDLGYFTKDKMVKEFADAAFALKKGEVSAPVKSSFGWHIIKLEDLRPVTIPTFNESRDQLKSNIQEHRLEAYIAGLVKPVDVKLFDAKGSELPFVKDPGHE